VQYLLLVTQVSSFHKLPLTLDKDVTEYNHTGVPLKFCPHFSCTDGNNIKNYNYSNEMEEFRPEYKA
jgi:hypothetical protein